MRSLKFLPEDEPAEEQVIINKKDQITSKRNISKASEKNGIEELGPVESFHH